MDPVRVPEAEQKAAVAATKAAARKRAAAPSWATIRSTFDPQGGTAKLNEKGETVGYEYPKPKDEAERVKLNAQVYEMWHPQRKVSMEMGAEFSARTSRRMVKVKTADGVREVLPEKAEKVDRIASTGRIRSLWTRSYSEAPYWKAREAKR